MKAKETNLWAKVLSASIIIGSLIASGFGLKVSVDDSIKAALAVYALFASIDINIALDKIFPTKAV
jgi:hypothetical protein